jgi:hypothetical protein
MKKKSFSIYIEENLMKKIRKIASDLKVPVGKLINYALEKEYGK